jgi:hypothetical protein
VHVICKNDTEAPCLNALLMQEVEDCLICLMDAQMATVSMMEWLLILPLKTVRNKAVMLPSGIKFSKI